MDVGTCKKLTGNFKLKLLPLELLFKVFWFLIFLSVWFCLFLARRVIGFLFCIFYCLLRKNCHHLFVYAAILQPRIPAILPSGASRETVTELKTELLEKCQIMALN